jgi:hypothetical protein
VIRGWDEGELRLNAMLFSSRTFIDVVFLYYGFANGYRRDQA